LWTAFDQSQATIAIAMPTTTICQKSPARRSSLSEMRRRLGRAGSGVDVVTAQGSFWKAAIFGHAQAGAFHMLHEKAISATYVS
jgi:hypothetical protein